MPAALLRPATRADIPAIFDVRYAVRENTLRPGVISGEDVRRMIEDSGRGWVVDRGLEPKPAQRCVQHQPHGHIVEAFLLASLGAVSS